LIEETGLKVERLKDTFEVGLGGKTRKIKEWCFVQEGIKGNPFHLISWVIEDLGQDEKGREIELLFGATDMQVWNIQMDLEKEKLDLSRFRKEFIEYNSVNHGRRSGVFNGAKYQIFRPTIPTLLWSPFEWNHFPDEN
jgi:hypothetical protein